MFYFYLIFSLGVSAGRGLEFWQLDTDEIVLLHLVVELEERFLLNLDLFNFWDFDGASPHEGFLTSL